MLDHVSHSQISMWLKCPHQWECKYVRGLVVPLSGALVLGGAYHTALEMNYKQKIVTREDLTVSECRDLFSDAWEERLAGTEAIEWEGDSPGRLKDLGLSLVEEYVRTISPTVQPIAVEEVYVSEIAGVKFLSRVDLVEERKIVIDHKTSTRPRTQEDIDTDLQASAEAFVLGRAIMFQNHIAVKVEPPYVQTLKSYRLDADIRWWYNMAAGVITLMKTGIAPPRIRLSSSDWYCSEKYCDYFDYCRGELVRSYF